MDLRMLPRAEQCQSERLTIFVSSKTRYAKNTRKKMAVPITTWGPAVWDAMHALSFTYPLSCENQCEKRSGMYDFLKSLTKLIPCETCRDHYVDWWERNASSETFPIFQSRDALSTALIELHNDVNERTGKTAVTYKSVSDRYATSRKTCPLLQRGSTLWVLLLGIVVLSIILLVAISRRGSSEAEKKGKRKVR